MFIVWTAHTDLEKHSMQLVPLRLDYECAVLRPTRNSPSCTAKETPSRTSSLRTMPPRQPPASPEFVESELGVFLHLEKERTMLADKLNNSTFR